MVVGNIITVDVKGVLISMLNLLGYYLTIIVGASVINEGDYVSILVGSALEAVSYSLSS